MAKLSSVLLDLVPAVVQSKSQGTTEKGASYIDVTLKIFGISHSFRLFGREKDLFENLEGEIKISGVIIPDKFGLKMEISGVLSL